MKKLFFVFVILVIVTCVPKSSAFAMTAGTTTFGPSACGITNYLLTTLPEHSILGTSTSGSSTTYYLTRFNGQYYNYQYQGSYFNELGSQAEQWFFNPDGTLTLIVNNFNNQGATFTGTWSGSFSLYLGTYTLNVTVSIAPCNNYTIKGVTYYMGT